MDKDFAQNKKIHVSKHDITINQTVREDEEKPYQCYVCDVHFLNMTDIQCHLNSNIYVAISCESEQCGATETANLVKVAFPEIMKTKFFHQLNGSAI